MGTIQNGVTGVVTSAIGGALAKKASSAVSPKPTTSSPANRMIADIKSLSDMSSSIDLNHFAEENKDKKFKSVASAKRAYTNWQKMKQANLNSEIARISEQWQKESFNNMKGGNR